LPPRDHLAIREEAGEMPKNETCRAFDESEVIADLDRKSLNRLIVGADPRPRKMTVREVKALGDVFAATFFAKGRIPKTAEGVIEGIKAAVPKKSPLRTQKSFIVGEGSQVAMSAQTTAVDRSLRFLVTLGEGQNGPDVFLSAGHPRLVAPVEVMAWDRKKGGFNYYRSSGPGAWMFAGNSRDAVRDSSRGKGPFESHPSGGLIMKELKAPWINWHSPDANIPPSVFAPGDDRRNHEWFTQKEPMGALAFETEAARPATQRWAKARFASLRDGGGPVTRPRHIMEQVLGTPNRRRSTVNLTTTMVENDALGPATDLFLPQTFFVDVEGLTGTLGLQFPPAFTVSGRIYKKCLTKFEVRMEDDEGFVRKGDTHFCFLVPERAFEDQVVLREAIEIGLLGKRLAACLLMVDPWNPVFSERRASLLRHVPATARIVKGRSSFSQEMVTAILAAAKDGPPDSPEAEFAQRWKAGPNFKKPFNKLLSRYYKAVTGRLKTQAGFEPYFKLAEARRRTFHEMPISEFPLLLPKVNIKEVPRRMRANGTVAEG
jgi:hypothetical protein